MRTNMLDSILNQKRVNLIKKICGESATIHLENELNSSLEQLLPSLDEKTSNLIGFISKIDNISNVNPDNKELYNIDKKKIHVINTQEAFNKAIQNVKKSKILGFDTEQKPVFQKGTPPSKMAIIQISDLHNAYVFQVQQIKNIKPLLEILASFDITKVGIGLRGDSTALQKEFGIGLNCCIDFGLLFKSKLFYANELGAKKGVLLFLNKKLQKSGRATRSNWENTHLTDSQIKYASEDAACVFDMFCEMLVNYSYLVEILPDWFRKKYDREEFKILLEDFQK